MKYKIIIIVFLSLKLISCNDYDVKNYPQKISFLDGFQNVDCKYGLEIDSFKYIPKKIQKLTKQYIIENIGRSLFNKCKFNYGLISSNNLIIIKNPNKSKFEQFLQDNYQESESFMDSSFFDKYDYPVYSLNFQIHLPEKGIKSYDLNLIIDNKGSILKEIDFPKVNIETYDFIAIDTIHKILRQKNISSDNLELNLRFDRNHKTIYYYARTLTESGNVFDCFRVYKYHFKVDAISGQFTEYNIKDDIDYFAN